MRCVRYFNRFHCVNKLALLKVLKCFKFNRMQVVQLVNTFTQGFKCAGTVKVTKLKYTSLTVENKITY